MVGRGIVDHRAHERLRVGERLVDDDPVDERLDRVEQLPSCAVFDDQPARRGAALAGGEIGRLDGDHRRRLDVLRAPHDQRIVAAELEREDLVRRLGELAVKRLAGARRAGEQQAVDAGLRRPARALVGAADQQPNAPSGTPASWKQRTRNAPVAGVFSDGLKTTALPAISAGTMWPLGRCAGKL